MTALIKSNPDAQPESDQIQAAVMFLAAKGVPVVLNVVIDFGAEDEIIKPGYGKDQIYFRNNIVRMDPASHTVDQTVIVKDCCFADVMRAQR